MQGEDKYINKLIGNYKIDTALNSGAFGKVYKGTHRYLTNRVVAIKVMHLNHLASDEERESFLQEAQFLEMFKHAHILPIYDVGVDDEGFPYLVAEFANNGSLRDRIKQEHPQLLLMDDVLQILSEVGQALQFVHEKNIVHRDLKPENILFNAKGEAMIADFGIAVFLESTKTKYVNVMGSPLYMAPEQFDGFASRRSDQYSLACIAYELLTGQPPFIAGHAMAIGMKHQREQPLPPTYYNPDVPLHVEKTLLKALEKKREDRYPDILSFISGLYTIPSGPLHKTREQWLDEGYLMFNLQRYPSALTAFEHALQVDPRFADAYDGIGATYYSLGKTEEALDAYQKALQLNPQYASAFNGQGNILNDQQEYKQALDAFTQAIMHDSNFVDAYVGKGNAHYYLNEYDEAIVAFEKALSLDPNSISATEGQGWVFWHARRYQEALVSFERALHLDPKNVSAYTGKGKALYNLGRYEDSLLCFDQAIHLDTRNDRTHEYKADALYRLKRYEEALAAYEQSIKLQPKIASSHEGRGWVLWNLKRYPDALSAFEQAIHINPNAAFPYNGKGNALYELGSFGEALAAYDRAIALNPRIGAVYNSRGNVLMELQRYEDALISYERASYLQPKVGMFYANKGKVLQQLGRTQEAEQAFAVAKQLGR